MADFLGARTQIYSLLTSIFVLLTTLLLAPVVAWLPRVTMAAIICTAAYSLLELKDILFLWRIRAWKELGLLTSTFLVTFFLGVDLVLTFCLPPCMPMMTLGNLLWYWTVAAASRRPNCTATRGRSGESWQQVA